MVLSLLSLEISNWKCIIDNWNPQNVLFICLLIKLKCDIISFVVLTRKRPCVFTNKVQKEQRRSRNYSWPDLAGSWILSFIEMSGRNCRIWIYSVLIGVISKTSEYNINYNRMSHVGSDVFRNLVFLSVLSNY